MPGLRLRVLAIVLTDSSSSSRIGLMRWPGAMAAWLGLARPQAHGAGVADVDG